MQQRGKVMLNGLVSSTDDSPSPGQSMHGRAMFLAVTHTVDEEIVRLLAGRRGHFLLESGHHGDLWLDLDGVFVRPTRVARFAGELATRLAAHEIEAVCGPLVGGAFLAEMIASCLDLEFFYSERSARRGGGLYAVDYRLPAALGGVVRGKRVAIVDDVVNAASATRATFEALRGCGARTVAIGALLTLGSAAPAFADEEGLALERLAALPNTLWEPRGCPLCAAGIPLETPAG
jgi:orotate phosphoribosyltransferase